MPRVRSSAAQAADPQQRLASAVGELSLEPASAAEDVVQGFSGGRCYRAYGHAARIFDLAFHPASAELLVAASDDCTASVWRRQEAPGCSGDGRYMQVASFRGHGDSVMRSAWSPDGRMVASGSSDGVACLWQPTQAALTTRHNLGDIGTRQLATLEGHPEEVYACIFLQQQQRSTAAACDPGGGGGGGAASHRLLTASGESLFLWDLRTQTQLQHVPPPPPPDSAAGSEHEVPERWRPGYLFGVAAQPDGPLLGAACSDGRLRLWAREGGDSAVSPLCTLPWNQAMGSDCCFGAQGLFAAVSKDGSCIIMDVRRGGCLHHLQLDAPLLSCTLLRDGGSQVLVAAGADGAVHLVDVASGDVASLQPEAAPHRPLLCAALSTDGAWLAASGEAVVLEEEDMLGSGRLLPEGGAGHKPSAKWSPIHIWQRGSSSGMKAPS